ncbi:MAG: hypothetical protein ACYSUV_09225 [Planctomycetota bacterium]|jgi:hypothetical protein
MRTLLLKAGGVVVVVLLAVGVGRVLRSGKTAGSATKLTPLKQTQEEGKGDVEPQRVTPPLQVKNSLNSSGPTLSAAVQPQEANPRAERLYQMALTALSEKDKHSGLLPRDTEAVSG